MITNQFTVLLGRRVILVPYEDFHVSKYHNWMQDSELQTLTASERLTLQEEYAMQRSWREDDDKCTFIVLDRKTFEESTTEVENEREMEAMIGDVNLFFIEEDEDEDDNVTGNGAIIDGGITDAFSKNGNSPSVVTAEVELMIAERSFRGQGRGKEAVSLLIHYGMNSLKVERFVAKIGSTNTVSLNLFEKIGFRRTKFNEVFDEVTLKADVEKRKKVEREETREGEKVEERGMFRADMEEMMKGVEMISREDLKCRVWPV